MDSLKNLYKDEINDNNKNKEKKQINQEDESAKEAKRRKTLIILLIISNVFSLTFLFLYHYTSILALGFAFFDIIYLLTNIKIFKKYISMVILNVIVNLFIIILTFYIYVPYVLRPYHRNTFGNQYASLINEKIYI